MNKLAQLYSQKGAVTLLGFDFSNSFEKLVKLGQVDCFIVSTEDGFSPLGRARDFFSRELGIDQTIIQELAQWNRFENPEVSLIGLNSQNVSSKLRGVVLAAGERSKCYKQLVGQFVGRPYRDFYYNVTYESIVYATNVLGARKIAISHLSGSNNFHEDIATCTAEALAHFCDRDQKEGIGIDSFLFVGCCISPLHLLEIQHLNREGGITKHHDILVKKSMRNGFEVISLDWKHL